MQIDWSVLVIVYPSPLRYLSNSMEAVCIVTPRWSVSVARSCSQSFAENTGDTIMPSHAKCRSHAMQGP